MKLEFDFEDECGTIGKLTHDKTLAYAPGESAHLGDFDWVFVVEPMGRGWPGKFSSPDQDFRRKLIWSAKLEMATANAGEKRPALLRLGAGPHKDLFKLLPEWVDASFWGPTYEQAMDYMAWFTGAVLQSGPKLTYAVIGGALKTDVLPIGYMLCDLGAEVTVVYRYCFPDELIYPKGVDYISK